MQAGKFFVLVGAIAASSVVMADDTNRPVSRAIWGSIRAVSAVSAVPLSIVGASLILKNAFTPQDLRAKPMPIRV